MTIPLDFMNFDMLVRRIAFKLEKCARVSLMMLEQGEGKL